MRTIYDLLQAAQAIDLPFEIELSFFDTRSDYVKLQIDQFKEGKRSDGENISPLHGRYPGYADRTIEIKKAKGQEYRFVTLRDKGDFHHGTFADVREEGIYVDSADDKTEILTDYYGPKIFGLEDKKKEPYALKAVGVLRENIVKELDKK